MNHQQIIIYFRFICLLKNRTICQKIIFNNGFKIRQTSVWPSVKFVLCKVDSAGNVFTCHSLCCRFAFRLFADRLSNPYHRSSIYLSFRKYIFYSNINSRLKSHFLRTFQALKQFKINNEVQNNTNNILMPFFNEYLSEMKEHLSLRALSRKKIQRNYLIIKKMFESKTLFKIFLCTSSRVIFLVS